MTVRLALILSILSLLSIHTGAARELRYTVDIRNTKTHQVHVTMVPAGFTAPHASFQMPVWAPGAYSVTHYGRYIRQFKAIDKAGAEIPVVQVSQDRWTVANGKAVAKIEYDILDSHLDTTSLYFAMAEMDTAMFFANATTLFGYYDDDKMASATIEYLKPAEWKLACPLYDPKPGMPAPVISTPFQNMLFYAKNYDVLVDAPIVASPTLHTQSFGVGSAMYDLAVASNTTFSDQKMDSLSAYLQKIVKAETEFFHDTPFNRYLFILYAPSISHMSSTAQGALEHANSSDYLLANAGWPFFKRQFLSIFSHEFFHLWNVKRIHSSLLGPFDYTQRVKTTSLWMAEGVTEYYAHTLLARAGMMTEPEFFDQINQWLQSLQASALSSRSKTLEQLSIDESDFNLDDALLFYIKGPLVALMLDLEIRNRTNNAKSLDDVMLALNRDAQLGKTFKEDELIHTVEKISGLDLSSFYARYIHGNDSLPIDRYLALMGVSESQHPGSASLTLSSNGQIRISAIDSASSLGRAGLKEGDFLLAANGTPLALENIDLLSSMKDSLTSATITIERAGQKMDVPVRFLEREENGRKKEGSMDIDLNAAPLARAIRNGILGAATDRE